MQKLIIRQTNEKVMMGWIPAFEKDRNNIRRYLMSVFSDDFVQIIMDWESDIFELLTSELDYDSGTIYN
jgi:hypothetical protein